jgi:hypothetical protein
MSRCLRARTLWMLSEGEGSREERDHVTSCVVCATRLRRLEQDLYHLQSVLSGPQPPRAALTHARPGRVRWTMASAALAAMVVLAWFGVWWQRPSPPFQMETRQESIWPFIDSVSTALFPTVEVGFTATPDRLSDLTDLQAALAGEWPCEGAAVFANLDCDDDDTFALLRGQE